MNAVIPDLRPMHAVDHDYVDALPLDFKQSMRLHDDIAFEEALADDLVPMHELKFRRPDREGDQL